ncbi:MAG: hypothetical protein ACI9TY_000171 [Alphaproteobacteria bacterium]|jgi:hypothetical protein
MGNKISDEQRSYDNERDHVQFKREVVVEIMKERFDVTKRCMSALFMANAGAIIAVPAFLALSDNFLEDWVFDVIGIYTFGIVTCLLSYFSFTYSLENLENKFNYDERSPKSIASESIYDSG